MTAKTETQRFDHLAAAAAAAPSVAGSGTAPPSGPGDELFDLIAAYVHDVATPDVLSWRPEDIAGATLAHRDHAASRADGEAIVNVYTPTVEHDAWSTGHTVVEIVTDDMPFLVDSVVGDLSSHGRTVLDLIHPQLAVVRDADGALLRVLGPAADHRDARPEDLPEGARVVRESWMHVEIARESDAEDRDAMRRRLVDVLADVRAAVADWEPMNIKVREVVDALRDDPPAGLPGEEVQRAIDVLDWFADGNFTFLGYRHYQLAHDTDAEVLRTVGDGLGILRTGDGEAGGAAPRERRLTGAAADKARERTLMVITKANARSTVHRQVRLDYVGIKTFDADGAVVGEHRFLGLFTVGAYISSVREVPYLREKVDRVLSGSGFAPDSHLAKDLLSVLEGYPRDELFQADIDDLARISREVVRLRERPGTRLFLRPDVYGRFMSFLVFLPRDRYTTAVRTRIQDLLLDAFDAVDLDYTTQVSDGPLARLHLVVRVAPGTRLPDVDESELEARLVTQVRSWEEDLTDALTAEVGEEESARMLARYGAGISEAYKETVRPRVAVADLQLAESVRPDGGVRISLSRVPGAPAGERRLKLASSSRVSLSRILPLLTNLGVEVTDERTFELRRIPAAHGLDRAADRAAGSDDGGESAETRVVHLYDVGVRAASEDDWARGPEGQDPEGAVRNFSEAFAAVWDGTAESDGLDRLVLGAGMNPREVTILRTLAAYLRQTAPYSRGYIEDALRENHEIARLLLDLFAARFDPDLHPAPGDDAGAVTDERRAAQEALLERLTQRLDAVASLDQDRILSAFRDIILATDRTNAYQHGPADGHRPAITLKLVPARVGHLTPPMAAIEAWVCSPRVEGVHMRYGKVARGGLRWSDRREDFRTEVQGLTKAQMFKNSVIVPTGAKGGFFAKQLPDASVDRDAWLAEGQAAYRQFIASLLDVADNLLDGEPVHPQRVVRHDDDDSYLVVAADKGTAAFSDLANAVSADYGFWLDDAFASGGSAGYSHKGMGITARGAWESVKRHFRELDIDIQNEDVTVVGIGDMSGDVFGNGMLLSEHLRLVAAFDHRHIFLDPDPDAATSHAERARLAALPRSSWADYDASLISAGGGVYPRTAKSVPISEQVRERLGLADGVTSLTPAELARSVLLAPVDLLWNGGIGTYVKSGAETNAEISDRANDAIRVDAGELRVRVIGEGGNLGMSQRGRIEAALHGIKLNTDAIDNSAGVGTSDHEVNIKILLGQAERAGDLTRKQRDELLVSMTDDVARSVLRDNYEQNVLLGNARVQDVAMVGMHSRLMAWLEERGSIVRDQEHLPSDEELRERAEQGKGLTSPEFAVLVAATKLALKEDLGDSDLAEDPWFETTLAEYFPEPLRERFADRIAEHPLRREIVTTAVANSMVNRGGISLVHRLVTETGASMPRVARAFVVVREIFGMRDFVEAVEGLDNVVPTDVQCDLYLSFRRLVDRATRWFLQNRPARLDIGAEIARFGPAVAELWPLMGELLRGTEAEEFEERRAELVERGVPADLAERAAGLLDLYAALDIEDLARELEMPVLEVGRVYHGVSELLEIDRLLTAASRLPRESHWETMARGALRDDLYLVLEELTRGVLAGRSAGADGADGADELVSAWARENEESVERVRSSVHEVLSVESGLAPLSVILRSLRSLARTVTAEA